MRTPLKRRSRHRIVSQPHCFVHIFDLTVTRNQINLLICALPMDDDKPTFPEGVWPRIWSEVRYGIDTSETILLMYCCSSLGKPSVRPSRGSLSIKEGCIQATGLRSDIFWDHLELSTSCLHDPNRRSLDMFACQARHLAERRYSHHIPRVR